jgi:2-C-methyl-D-erythritol 4-phosphate cytidylyltransferase
MKPKVTAILTAAGSGKRFAMGGKDTKPKQFQLLAGKSVILHSMLALQKCRDIDEIIISADNDYFELIHSLALRNKITKLLALVEGGKTRFESVKNAFHQINGHKNDIVLIHDAARPNITAGFVLSIVAAARRSGNVIPACKVSETIKRAKNGVVKETLKRDELWLVQTPQAFKYSDLETSYKKTGRKKDFTDEATLVEYAGFRVNIIAGLRNNIKITTPEDLLLLKKIMP